ncbi:PQ loop repeat-domain-containing protein [Cantharellus anzutake]|uniref:PQ loop repeat-domain-containing protein n=1 Tax=Cantharellus anzutake TaxID=1750568 RepID=UPI001904B11B|nr:PQ loop repeat-domain-containing protein [Cantharellus anzutake]KAF8326520.1 PQ loop repeat-domain-containing protein [Cantharellus anzutake]
MLMATSTLPAPEAAARALSVVLGWTYFFAWSFSFYPQILLNYRRKFVGGLSIDFATLNVMGHTCYSIYSSAFLFSPGVREEYRRRHDGHNPSVQLNDVAFALHAATLASITLIQTWIYPREIGQRLSTANRFVVAIALFMFTTHVFSITLGTEPIIDFLYILSYFKLYVSVAKYVPQVWDNYRRKSTIGWSIGNILLDLTGGSLSLIQLFIDASADHDWAAVTGNPVKFGLSILTIIFDMVFVIQHYALYTTRKDFAMEDKEGLTKSDLEAQAAANMNERTRLLSS